MARVSSMVRKANTPGRSVRRESSVYIPSIGGMKERLPVAMMSWSYGVTRPSSEKTTLAKRSIRLTRTPACRVMPFCSYHSKELRKMSVSASSPDSTWLSMIRL